MIYLLCISSFAVAVIALGFSYQSLGSYYDRRRYASEGRWIDIGEGRRLYLLEKGSGETTVLFESGIAATNLNWCHIQEKVSSFSTTASYDRSGLGDQCLQDWPPDVFKLLKAEVVSPCPKCAERRGVAVQQGGGPLRHREVDADVILLKCKANDRPSHGLA